MKPSSARHRLAIPPRAGVGLKPAHYRAILDGLPDIGFFEIHAENYMGAGGPPHRYLEAIRDRYPLSLHGVGLSIGADAPLDREHLARLRALDERYQPGLFSEHLAWSTHEGAYLNDLLPVPYTPASLHRVCQHVEEVQTALRRQMLIENPSTYIVFADSTMSEVEFLAALVERTGCGLLLDISNVQVSATNHGFDPHAYLDAFPLERVHEIHLGSFTISQDDAGGPLLIDAHASPIAAETWALFAQVLDLIGPKPTLIERDNDVPTWPALAGEAERAEQVIRRVAGSRGRQKASCVA